MFAIENRCAFPCGPLCCTLLAAVILATSGTTFAQPVAQQRYKSIPPKMTPREAKPLQGQVANAMRNVAAFQADGQKNIDRYFKTFYFPMMTQTGPADLTRLGKLREDLFKRYLRGATVPAAQSYLTNLTLNIMPKIARDNYHPSVRYNATLILGMLDQEYPNPNPPVALPAGTNQLLELLEQNEFNGVKVHPSVKVGALEGLERHVRFGLDAQYADRVTQAALAVLAQEPSALDVDADVNNWIKCQAASLLSRQFAAGPNVEVHTALTKMISDDNMSLADRCCVVGLLEKIKFDGAAGVDVASTLVPLGNLTKEVVAEGAEKAQEYQNLRLGKGPRARRRGGSRGPQEPKLERRQLLACLTSIENGASSLAAGLPDEQKQKVQSLIEVLEPVMEISKNGKSLDLDVMGAVLDLEDSVNNLVASWQPAAPAVEPADAGFVE